MQSQAKQASGAAPLGSQISRISSRSRPNRVRAEPWLDPARSGGLGNQPTNHAMAGAESRLNTTQLTQPQPQLTLHCSDNAKSLHVLCGGFGKIVAFSAWPRLSLRSLGLSTMTSPVWIRSFINTTIQSLPIMPKNVATHHLVIERARVKENHDFYILLLHCGHLFLCCRQTSLAYPLS